MLGLPIGALAVDDVFESLGEELGAKFFGDIGPVGRICDDGGSVFFCEFEPGGVVMFADWFSIAGGFFTAREVAVVEFEKKSEFVLLLFMPTREGVCLRDGFRGEVSCFDQLLVSGGGFLEEFFDLLWACTHKTRTEVGAVGHEGI